MLIPITDRSRNSALQSAEFLGGLDERKFEDLEVWQFSMDVVYFIYDVTASFPKDELYGIISQMRRAAVSIPSKMLIAQHLGYLSTEAAKELKTKLDRVGRMLNGLISFTSGTQRVAASTKPTFASD